VDVDPNEAARLGVNRAVLSLSLAGAYGGQTVATLWEDGESIPVNLYSVSDFKDMSYESIGNQMITTSIPGVYVPLRQVAQVNPLWEPESIPHISGKESITVYADMKYGRSQPEAMRVLKKYVSNKIEPNLPEGVTVSYEGLSTVNRKVVPEVLLTLICAIAILFFFLLFHFKKMSLATLTLVLSLLCLFGATFGLWVFRLDFGMTAVLGIVSLIGIVVRNGILMFDHAEELRVGTGMTVKEAAMEAGKRRMRPIFLTSCTTALGVLPMIITGDALWMPMGVVICFGTMLSIILIVEIMPVCYWQVFKTKGGPDAK
jgi:multidrug efflux pump subunit AcrB